MIQMSLTETLPPIKIKIVILFIVKKGRVKKLEITKIEMIFNDSIRSLSS
jgi:hypothetical protein